MLDYPYFKKHDKVIAISLGKQQELDADPKAPQVSNFTGNLDWAGNAIMFSILEEVKEIILGFSKRILRVL